MRLIFRPLDRARYEKCLHCKYFGELKHETVQGKKTVEVVCYAMYRELLKCEVYKFLKQRGRIGGDIR